MFVQPIRDVRDISITDVFNNLSTHIYSRSPDTWPKLKNKGWSNYHKHVVSSKTFGYVDNCI
ncbi:MAG: hypothetical protein GY714_26980 [Desulfobacterales bacterium]|nr:hypothetical protein [Desulfobacterales bacterium]